MALWAAVFRDKIPLTKAIDRYSSERWHYARGMAKTQLNKNARARANTACSKFALEEPHTWNCESEKKNCLVFHLFVSDWKVSVGDSKRRNGFAEWRLGFP